MADETVSGSAQGLTYRAVRVRPGPNGWGTELIIQPTATKNKVVSVTGGGVDPVAKKIAELTGAEAVDGFRTGVPDDQIACVVIDCGGTARIGVYPRKKILTIDVYPGAPAGPLQQFITDDLFVSAVGPAQVELLDSSQAAAAPRRQAPVQASAASPVAAPVAASGGGAFAKVSDTLVRFGSGIGYVVNTLLASGRQSVNLTISTILPFMAYVSLLLGIVLYTGIARDLGGVLKPLATNPVGLVIIGVIVALPFLSPILGPGAAVAQIIGVLMGAEIALGVIPVQYALPTLFAIDGQVGCDFIPVGLGLGEAQPETVAVGTPAVLFSRQITSPLAVVLAWLASFGMYAR